MKKVIITATLTMTVFSATPLVTPAQAFAASKPAQVHVVEENPSISSEQSLDFIEADAALATYNSGSLDTINRDDSTLAGKGVSHSAKKNSKTKVWVWNKNGKNATKRNRLTVRNMTVSQTVTLWMREMQDHTPKKNGSPILINGGRNYAIRLTDGTKGDLEKAMRAAITSGVTGQGYYTNQVINTALCKKNYKNGGESPAKIYKKYGVVILRGANSEHFDYAYWQSKCIAQCAKDMNLAQYENEPQARRDKDVSFAVMEWCRKHAFYGYTKHTYKALYNKNAITYCTRLAGFVTQLCKAYGVDVGMIDGGDHTINVLKAGGKYYYMDFQGNENVVCSINFYVNSSNPCTPEYTQLLKEISKIGLPMNANWDVVTEKVNNASPELHALADTVVKQMEAKNPESVLVKDGGEMKYWSPCYSGNALLYFVCQKVYNVFEELDLPSMYCEDEIVNGRMGYGEANWLTFKESAGIGEKKQYKQTPYGRILGGYDLSDSDDHNVLGFKTEESLLKANPGCENLSSKDTLKNLHF